MRTAASSRSTRRAIGPIRRSRCGRNSGRTSGSMRFSNASQAAVAQAKVRTAAFFTPDARAARSASAGSTAAPGIPVDERYAAAASVPDLDGSARQRRSGLGARDDRRRSASPKSPATASTATTATRRCCGCANNRPDVFRSDALLPAAERVRDPRTHRRDRRRPIIGRQHRRRLRHSGPRTWSIRAARRARNPCGNDAGPARRIERHRRRLDERCGRTTWTCRRNTGRSPGGVDAAVATLAAGVTRPGQHVAMIGSSMCWGYVSAGRRCTPWPRQHAARVRWSAATRTCSAARSPPERRSRGFAITSAATQRPLAHRARAGRARPARRAAQQCAGRGRGHPVPSRT